MSRGASRLEPASGNSPSETKWRHQHGSVARDHLIAMQQHGGANADRGAADRRNQGLFAARQSVEKAHDRRAESAARRHRDEIVKVIAGTENISRAR